MEHPTVKQEQLGEGETSSEMERLSQCLREFDTEIAREMEQAKSRTEERRSPATDRMWPGWVPESTTTDTRSQARPRADQPDDAQSCPALMEPRTGRLSTCSYLCSPDGPSKRRAPPSESIASLTETLRDIVAVQQAIIKQRRPPQPTGPRLCWGCKQPSHIRAYCPRQAPQPKISQSSVGNERGPRTSIRAHLHLNFKVEGVHCTTLIDTGSIITLVRPDILQQASQSSWAKVATMVVQLWMVTGQLSPMRGRGILQLHLGETAFDQQVWVTDIQDQCILWLDFLQQTRGRLDLVKGTMTFGAGPRASTEHK
ncbi:hypothetical protein EOD39_18073 [Acipenser ruthenus]|uniref:CCHC-type domain-containing protein n=1 Tax=Acipenser ruthenus TaxID=7906 RepID=A0A444V1Q1_ACIRT|nr:hypothetical protein EOD39_18073 [Acipenser ruthenus]